MKLLRDNFVIELGHNLKWNSRFGDVENSVVVKKTSTFYSWWNVCSNAFKSYINSKFFVSSDTATVYNRPEMTRVKQV